MNQAKEELYTLALEAFKGGLPFGNPVKDFCGQKLNLSDIAISNEVESFGDKSSDKGLLDYRVELEEGFEELVKVIDDIGVKMQEKIISEVTKAAENLNSVHGSAKRQRNVVSALAAHLQEFSSFVKLKNERYREVLKKIENSLEFILGEPTELDDDAKLEFQGFIDVLCDVENSGYKSRQSVFSLIGTMESLPKIEKTFNRAKSYVVGELRDFVTNIDQTISVILRAIRLGKAMIEKSDDSKQNDQ